jgi:zinc protease
VRFLALLLVAVPLHAQFPSEPPKVGAPQAYRAPQRRDFRLETGIPVTLIEDRRSPLVTATLAFNGGTAKFVQRGHGLIEIISALVTAGTVINDAQGIALRADSFGGTIAGEATEDTVAVHASALADRAQDMLHLMGEVVGMSHYPMPELNIRKANMIEELRVARSQSAWLADLAFRRHVFGLHPYAEQADEESIKAINRGTVQLTVRDLLRGTNARLFVVGDITPTALKKALQHWSVVWDLRVGVPLAPVPGPREAEVGRRVLLVDRPGSAQTALRIGRRAVPEAHPDYFPLLVANQVLGGSYAARLNVDLRERKGWTYGIYSSLRERRSAASFVIATEVRTKVTKKAIARIFGHLKRIRRKKVGEDELVQAKNVLIGDFVRGLETQDGLAAEIVHADMFNLGKDWPERYVERVAAVTQDDVLRVARVHFDPKQMVVVAVGDGKKIARGLKRFGTPLRVGVDGKVSGPYAE